jgi:hypothetical protein
MTNTVVNRPGKQQKARPQGTVRARLGALCLAGGALGFAVVAILNPYGPAEDQAEVARQHSGTIAAYSLTWFVASLLLVGGAASAVGRVQGRGRTLALVSGALVVSGSVASAAIAGFESVAITLASAVSDDKELSHVLKAFDSSGVLAVIYVVFLGGVTVGLPLLFGAAARARMLSVWWVVPVTLGVLAQGSLTADSSLGLTLAVLAAFVAPCLVLAWRLATERHAEASSLGPSTEVQV